MPETDNGIRETLDVAHITTVAKLAASSVKKLGVARVELTPGDRTSYEITLIAPWVPVFVRESVGGEPYRLPREGLVSLLHGDTYPWPQIHIHSSYAAEKWGRESSWTGVVVAEFLNAVNDALEGPP